MSNPIPGNFSAVLDACVLWPNSLRDTLLRLAESPRQYIPKWTDQIWYEVARNLEARGRSTQHQTKHLVEEVHTHFPESFVTGYEPFVELMQNDPKDRHVLAAAVRCGAQVIVTSNLKDFPFEVLAEWGIEPQHPDDFLVYQCDLNPAVVISKLHEQAANINRSLPALLRTLQKGVPNFADMIARKLEFDLSERGK
jgi:predicted nucleic acid-binding protein